MNMCLPVCVCALIIYVCMYTCMHFFLFCCLQSMLSEQVLLLLFSTSDPSYHLFLRYTQEFSHCFSDMLYDSLIVFQKVFTHVFVHDDEMVTKTDYQGIFTAWKKKCQVSDERMRWRWTGGMMAKLKYLNYLSMPLIISFGIFRFRTRIRFVSDFFHDENVNFSDGLCRPHDEAHSFCCSCKTKNIY